jgi:site-specific recombinase XerC
MTPSNKVLAFLQPASSESEWITTYDQAVLASKRAATRDVYRRILQQFASFAATLPGMEHQFMPAQITGTVVDAYLSTLQEEGSSASHRQRVKSVLKSFCQWLLDEQQMLSSNPVRGVKVAAQTMLTPRILTPEQRFVLRNVVERQADVRGQAIFALGYGAGCRVSDVAHLLMANTHVGPKLGWLAVGHKGGKLGEIDLVNDVRRPLLLYLQHGGRDESSHHGEPQDHQGKRV